VLHDNLAVAKAKSHGQFYQLRMTTLSGFSLIFSMPTYLSLENIAIPRL
jgi:hypothetical protein